MFDLNTRTGWSSGSGQDGQVVRQLASLPLGPGFKPSPGTTGICPQTLPGLSNTFPINFHFSFTVLNSDISYFAIFPDTNECSADTHNCHVNATCSDTFGSFVCKCKSGFIGNGTTCRGYLHSLFIFS